MSTNNLFISLRASPEKGTMRSVESAMSYRIL